MSYETRRVPVRRALVLALCWAGLFLSEPDLHIVGHDQGVLLAGDVGIEFSEEAMVDPANASRRRQVSSIFEKRRGFL